ncbi:MAG: pantetheine-phosphate adenylyltransferase [SAR324 cluster bacterium]|nr:pantetheine-phosphate adenylyltransferase [SAR324 cluster bacterium]
MIPETSSYAAIYPLSANPPTWGHADIVSRAAKIFDKVYWSVAFNPDKKYLFSVEERMSMMQVYIDHFQLTNVIPDSYTGSTVRYAQQKQVHVLIKGLRNYSDFQQEFQQAVGNKGIDEKMETFCLFGAPGLTVVSSSLVRELAFLGEDITPYVHPAVAQRVSEIIHHSKT